jgi:hypothetical protein
MFADGQVANDMDDEAFTLKSVDNNTFTFDDDEDQILMRPIPKSGARGLRRNNPIFNVLLIEVLPRVGVITLESLLILGHSVKFHHSNFSPNQ